MPNPFSLLGLRLRKVFAKASSRGWKLCGSDIAWLVYMYVKSANIQASAQNFTSRSRRSWLDVSRIFGIRPARGRTTSLLAVPRSTTHQTTNDLSSSPKSRLLAKSCYGKQNRQIGESSPARPGQRGAYILLYRTTVQ